MNCGRSDQEKQLKTNPRGGFDIVRTLGVFFIETKRGNEDE
ncbi:MAG: hypothetical protein ACC608_00800 [Anaerofustis sp.]|jgi:hypothetical protein